MGETYYDVLEIDPEASRDEIESAYRERVLETHPDHNDAPDATEQFRRLSRARDVLSDGDERARYDRLGHDAYVRLAQHAAEDSSDTDTESAQNAGNGNSGPTSSRRSTANATGYTSSASWSDGSTQQTAANGATEATSGTHRGSTTGRTQTRGTTAAGTATGASDGFGSSSTGPADDGVGSAPDDSAAAFRYAVHDWDGQIDFEWNGRQVTHSTAVTVGCLWLLYPGFVASSVLPAAPLPVNVILAACTIAIVGYLLTWPRLSAVLFGSWSLLFPIALVAIDDVSLLSMVGVTTLGFAWVPFGYALGLWWALRPSV